jgi:hypothetical protein
VEKKALSAKELGYEYKDFLNLGRKLLGIYKEKPEEPLPFADKLEKQKKPKE